MALPRGETWESLKAFVSGPHCEGLFEWQPNLREPFSPLSVGNRSRASITFTRSPEVTEGCLDPNAQEYVRYQGVIPS